MSRHSLFLTVALGVFAPVVMFCSAIADDLPLDSGDKVVARVDCPVKSGRDPVAHVQSGTELVAVEVRGNWIGVVVQQDGRDVSGWLDAKHLRATGPLPGSPEKPLNMRLCWKPGDTLTYQCSMQMVISAAGQRLTSGASLAVDVHVLPTNSKTEPSGVNTSSPGGVGQGVTLGFGQLMELELIHRDMSITAEAAGKEFRATVTKDAIDAYLDDQRIPAYQMDELRKECKPIQDLLGARVRVLMTEHGRIVKVSGLEKLDPKAQKELARGFLQAVALPDKPMTLGDQFKITRKLEDIWPQDAGPVKSLAGRTLDLVFTLADVERRDDWTTVARLKAPLKTRLENVPLDESGTTGSADFDIETELLYDVGRGTITKQSVAGTVDVHIPGQGSAAVKLEAVFDEQNR